MRIALCIAGMLLSSAAIADDAHEITGEYVISRFYPSSAVQSKEQDCPHGMEDKKSVDSVTDSLRAAGKTTAELEFALSDFPSTAYYMLGTRAQVNGRPADTYLNPTALPDMHLKTVEGQYALGFNLDGKAETGGFTDPESGEKGVDNQLFRVYGCTNALRSDRGTRSAFSELVWAYAQPRMNAWLLQVSGIKDLQNSRDVVVRISNASSRVVMDAKGLVQRDMTFQEDGNLVTTTTVHGTINKGVLTTDIMPTLNLYGDLFEFRERRWTKARLRLKFEPDGSATGLIGGYHKWAPLYMDAALSAGDELLSYQFDVPSFYYAFRKFADAEYDPKLKLNTAISTAYSIEAVPAFVRPASTPGDTNRDAAARASSTRLPSDVPRGITIKVVRIGNPVPQKRERVVFASDNGVVLYTSADDPHGASRCVGECAKTWMPELADANAKPIGQWSLITRADGARQWAFRGKALYIYARDAAVPKALQAQTGEARAAIAFDTQTQEERTAAALVALKECVDRDERDHEGVKVNSKSDVEGAVVGGFVTCDVQGQGLDGHHVVEILPEEWMQLPVGIRAQEVRMASGYVLTDTRGLPLYAGPPTGVGARSSKQESQWLAFAAPEAAVPIGDFTIHKRNDGLMQWAYKGKALYRFAGDLDDGDANGAGLNPDFRLVYAFRYFMPDGVTVQNNHMYGGLLALDNGMLLYARDGRKAGLAVRGYRGRLAVGEQLGVASCDTNCEKSWRPLIAPDDAESEGYWTVLSRPDGRKQWAYCGYALYSPVDPNLKSTEIYDSFTNFEARPNGEAREIGPLHWRVAVP